MARSPQMPARIVWHEGMLLAPQHFQQAEARVDALVAWHALAANPFGWGVRHLEFDRHLFAASRVRVTELEAVMPDGTAVQYFHEDAAHGSLDLDLAPHAEALATGKPLDIWLTLPKGRSLRDPGAPARFRTVNVPLVEDEVSEAVAAEMSRLVPNLGLAAGPVPSGLYSHMRIAAVYRDNEVVKQSETLPPLLQVTKRGEFWERASGVAGQLRSKAAFLAKQTSVPSSKAEDRLAYLEHKERLRNLLDGLPALEAVLRTPHLHPYSLYLALSALLGPLSMLRPGALPPVPPVYDHADPVATFEPLLAAVDDALGEVSQEYRELKFEFKHGAFELVLQPEWVQDRLVIGARGQSEKDLAAWIEGAIIGSQSAYASLRERRVLGAQRTHIDSAEELGVRASTGYTLFAIQTSPSLTVAGQPLIISNSAESAMAQRPQEVVLFAKGG